MEDIKARIKKLLDMAMHERGNEHENEVALRMANRLMAKHGIDAADLELQTGKKTVYSWDTSTLPVAEKGKIVRQNHPQWIGWMAVGIGKFTDCRVTYVTNPVHGVCVRYQGDVVDVEFASYLFKMMRDYGYAESKSVPGSDRGSFLKGYALRLCQRITALLNERKEVMAAASSTALVVVETKIALRDQEFGAQTYGKTRPQNRVSNAGYSAGRAAAERVNFSRPVGQNSQTYIK